MKQLLSDEDFEYFSTMVLLVKTFEAAIDLAILHHVDILLLPSISSGIYKGIHEERIKHDYNSLLNNI